MKKETLKQNITSKREWIRFLFILLFSLIFKVTMFIVSLLVIFQFVYNLITAKKNQNVLDLSDQLVTYAKTMLNYLTYNADTKPYPFTKWPAKRKNTPTNKS